ncbi:MAG: Flp pilus assembly protein CpaB [Bacillota bacterium]
MRRQWPILVAVVLGLIVAGASAFYLLKFSAENQKLTQIVVPKKEIPAYSMISADNVGLMQVPVGSVGPNVAVDPSQVLGVITTVPLYPQEQIRLERLAKKEMADNSKFNVAVNINLTRSVGGLLAPGDIVDIYFVKNEDAPAALLATDSHVVAVLDGQGNNLANKAQSNIINNTNQNQPGLPAVVVVAVKPEEVAQVSRGSNEESKSVVLVKKFKEGGSVAVANTSSIQNTK